MGPAVILVSIVFGGLFVNEANVPAALAWVPQTSLIKQVGQGRVADGGQPTGAGGDWRL